MNNKVLLAVLKKSNKKQTAKFPVSVSVLRQVPFFTEVFSEDDEILKRLSQLADQDSNAFIRYKAFESEEIIINQGDFENTVFWLLKGDARVRSGDEILTHIKPVICFGEQTVVDAQGRTATVDVPENKNAEVVEIDWSITEQDHELLDRFVELLLRNTTNKLKIGYKVSTKMWHGARELYSVCKKRTQELEIENEELKLMNRTLKKKLNL
ncbi:MAG: cyclic nucleotide-binding domain-containing protein [Nitrospina sp.]|nr:cyclic nucleotide-binding domain-containing protein [Nitrospina sp.]MBT5632585.1 cyclic nucleotide-binding domain-containing protein [Nitrospina sp.]